MGKRKVITAVTSRVDFFVPYISSNFSYIRMGNDGASEIKGKIENICLETNIGQRFSTRDAVYIYGMWFNLISITKPNDGGFSNHFIEGKWKFTFSCDRQSEETKHKICDVSKAWQKRG